MSAVEIVGLAASVSLLAGWRLYFCVFVTGLAMKTGWIELPTHLSALTALANPWVLGAAFAGLVAEFFADKILWLDSAWDAVHTFVRPVGGALLALAIVDAGDPAWQVLAFLLGGGGAFLAHSAKASSRALVNVSPEPVSNVIVSSVEDVATGGLLALALAYPIAALGVAVVLLGLVVLLLVLARRTLRALFRLGKSAR
ncbi:MAG TPA: DUF4126 domain-containing protein [Allosphingosinicella sp.]|nr:DUF4126 domain-containing protein [Allosphingosinicella sp.]